MKMNKEIMMAKNDWISLLHPVEMQQEEHLTVIFQCNLQNAKPIYCSILAQGGSTNSNISW